MIKRIVASNFRSLGEDVSIELGPLTALVGVNGSGKSGVADAIQFVAHCVGHGLDVALTLRGGLGTIRHAASAADAPVSLRIEVESDEGAGFWSFSLGEDPAHGHRVLAEEARWDVSQAGRVDLGLEPIVAEQGDVAERYYSPHLHRRGDVVEWNGERMRDFGGRQPLLLPLDIRFSPLRAILGQVVIYKIFPNSLRQPQHLDFGQFMREHGENWASVLHRLDRDLVGRYLLAALGQIVGDIDDYRTTPVGGYVIPEFRHVRSDGTSAWLGAAQESDGTLRAAGILTALLQEPPLTLIGFEEPELTVHPGAIGVLFDHFRAASTRGQVLLTTHSSELMDLLDIDEIRVVERRDGKTIVSRVDEAQRALVKKRLATTSELVWSEGLRGATGTDG